MALLTLGDIYNSVTGDTGLSYISTVDYTTALFLTDARTIGRDLQSELLYSKNDAQNSEIWYADTVSLQYEYTKPAVSSDDVGADRIDSVAVTYNSDTYTETGLKKYVPCKQATIEEMKNWEFLLENQPQEIPLYYQYDKSVFIAPDPRTTEVGTNRIKITGARSIEYGAWATTTNETAIKLPFQLLEALTLGIVWKANARARVERNIVIDSKNEYIAEKRRAIRSLNLETSEVLSDDVYEDPIIK